MMLCYIALCNIMLPKTLNPKPYTLNPKPYAEVGAFGWRLGPALGQQRVPETWDARGGAGDPRAITGPFEGLGLGFRV